MTNKSQKCGEGTKRKQRSIILPYTRITKNMRISADLDFTGHFTCICTRDLEWKFDNYHGRAEVNK